MKMRIWLDVPDPAPPGALPSLLTSFPPYTRPAKGYRRFTLEVDVPVTMTTDGEPAEAGPVVEELPR